MFHELDPAFPGLQAAVLGECTQGLCGLYLDSWPENTVRCGFGGRGGCRRRAEACEQQLAALLLISEGAGVTCVFFIVRFCPVQGLSGAIV